MKRILFYCEGVDNIEGSCLEQCSYCVKKELNLKGIGLGDVVEMITDVTGIKKIVQMIKPQGCNGCNHRKQVLNKIRFKK